MATGAPSPAPAAPPPLAQVGQTIEEQGYRFTVTNVETAASYGIYDADAGKQLLAVEVLVESSATSGVDVNPFYFSVQDSDGYEYTISIFGKDPSLQSQNDLPSGEKMRGRVTFEVPTSAHGLVLKFEPLSFGGGFVSA